MLAAKPDTALIGDRGTGDAIACIIGSLESRKFTGETRKIHTTLARLHGYYPVIESLHFTEGDVYPFSRSLEDALTVMQRSRLVRMENPDYDAYVVTAAGKAMANRILDVYPEEESSQLRELAKIVDIELAIPDDDLAATGDGLGVVGMNDDSARVSGLDSGI